MRACRFLQLARALELLFQPQSPSKKGCYLCHSKQGHVLHHHLLREPLHNFKLAQDQQGRSTGRHCQLDTLAASRDA